MKKLILNLFAVVLVAGQTFAQCDAQMSVSETGGTITGTNLSPSGIFREWHIVDWSVGPVFIDTVESLNFTVPFDGTFRVCLNIEDAQGFVCDSVCKELQNVVLDTTVTGIRSSDNKGIEIYPNPVSETLFIKTHLESKTKVNYNIIDVTGKVIEAQQLPFSSEVKQIDVFNLPKGFYVIELLVGDEKIQKQFIKK